MIKKIKISCLMSYCNLQEEEEKEDILPELEKMENVNLQITAQHEMILNG